jgi:hypothetical protein
VPLAALTLAGRQPLGLIALLGAFTALYGSTLRLAERLYLLPLVAAGFVAASGLGILGAANARGQPSSASSPSPRSPV